MGSVEAKHIEALPSQSKESFALYLHCSGCIYMINISDEPFKIITDTISKEWSPKYTIKETSPHLKRLSFSDNPFSSINNARETLQAKRLFAHIPTDLQRAGWHLVNAPIMNNRNGLSTWIFAKSPMGPSPPMPTEPGFSPCVAISISSSDKLQIIDCNETVTEALRTQIKSVWYKGIQDDKLLDAGQTEIVLEGTPWHCTGNESLQARAMLLALINTMDRHGYKLSNSTALKTDACDCMYFTRHSNEILPETMQKYFLLALKSNDYLVFIGADPPTIAMLNAAFSRYYRHGVKPPTTVSDFPMLKFHGSPWGYTWESEVEIKSMFCAVLQELAVQGWHPIESLDCSRSLNDKSTLAFGRAPPTRLHYMALMPSGHSTHFLVNAPPDIVNIYRDIMTRFYTPGIEDGQGALSWRVNFKFDPVEGLDTKGPVVLQYTILAFITAVRELGWNIMCSADLANHTERQNKTTVSVSAHTLFFAKIIE